LNLRRHKAKLIATAAVFLLTVVVILSRHYTTGPTPISVTFLGMTNDPGTGGSFSTLSFGYGPHALFRCTSFDNKVAFGISGIEKQIDGVWTSHHCKFFPLPLGLAWTTGHSNIFALPWPQGLSTNSVWRLDLWVTSDPSDPVHWIERKLGHSFPLFHRVYTVTSSPVTPPPASNLHKP
jgi:hypothetical protein